MLFAGGLLMRDLRQRRVTWLLIAWIGMFIAALLMWDRTNILGSPPTWFWQMVFVPLGVVLAAGPLLHFVDDDRERGARADRLTSGKT
jgi:predicted MFS family arabinose efflux permease